ncbi:prepilin-type N-terminal cleavage/methylation domain-containing protein [bacterium]|nr:MAG: prepilin-type N-terminal cleavage/methylation domain-containing protein [bacterium]
MSNARAPKRQRGFTLLEAMAAVVLLGIGIATSVGSFGTLARSESNTRQTEKMYRLAQAKLAELVATGQATASSDGDFTEQNEPDYTWRLEVNTSGITDLDAVTLSVGQRDSSRGEVRLDTLVYVPPETTTGTGTP